MSNALSEMIITKIHAFNRINAMENAVGGYTVPRDKSAIAIKTEGCTEYKSAGIHYLSDSSHAILLPKGAVYSWICKQKGECLMIEFDGENWSLMDPTLASNNDSKEVQEYIGDGSKYVVKYTY